MPMAAIRPAHGPSGTTPRRVRTFGLAGNRVATIIRSAAILVVVFASWHILAVAALVDVRRERGTETFGRFQGFIPD
jgi:hypothetical protein